jgi:hypothetical protein
MQELVMKCEVCIELLEEYFDGELAERESTDVAAHLMTCMMCTTESAGLAAEQELFSRYDRDLEVSPAMWRQISERTCAPSVTKVFRNGFGEWLVGLFRVPSFGFSVATAALILIAVLVGAAYLRSRKPEQQQSDVVVRDEAPAKAPEKQEFKTPDVPKSADRETVAVVDKRRTRRSFNKPAPIDQSDVLSADFGYQDPDDRDTAKHIEQTQNLLRSIRNVQVNDGEQEIDVTYDKAVSRRLLSENIVLRRDAEMKAKFPTKALLSDLEPLLIDIANLPDQAKPDDVRAIKERVQKTEIVAALIGFD